METRSTTENVTGRGRGHGRGRDAGGRRRSSCGNSYAAAKRRRDRIKKALNAPSTNRFKFVSTKKEPHKKPIYSCKFNPHFQKGDCLVLATVGGHTANIYECTKKGPLRLLHTFEEEDQGELFYTCAWTYDFFQKPLLAVAGLRGIIRILSLEKSVAIKTYQGHGGPINEVLFHPKDPNFLFSTSLDHSARLWNIYTNTMVVIFAGDEGHIDEVLSADVDPTGKWLMSFGLDHAMKLWDLEDAKVEQAMKDSYAHPLNADVQFATYRQMFPNYTTRDVHNNYVDCGKWFGDLVVSKSCQNEIVFWKGGLFDQSWDELDRETEEVTVVNHLVLEDSLIWFLKFSMSANMEVLAVGTAYGKLYVFDLTLTDDLDDVECNVLKHPRCTGAVRNTALSKDGKTLICVCDDSTIWRWEDNRDPEQELIKEKERALRREQGEREYLEDDEEDDEEVDLPGLKLVRRRLEDIFESSEQDNPVQDNSVQDNSVKDNSVQDNSVQDNSVQDNSDNSRSN